MSPPACLTPKNVFVAVGMDADTTAIRERLDAGLVAVQTALEGLPEPAALVRPAPDRWSAVECVEHLVRAEDYLLAQLAAGRRTAPVVNESREARIVEIGINRHRRISAPEISQPTGRWATVADAKDALHAVRERTIEFIEQFDGDLRGWQATHPIAGAVSGYEMLLMIAVHAMRHARQIAEIRSAASVK